MPSANLGVPRYPYTVPRCRIAGWGCDARRLKLITPYPPTHPPTRPFPGVGGTPEGVIAAAALKCMGGHIEGEKKC